MLCSSWSQIIADVCCDVAMGVQVPSLEELVHHINMSSSVFVLTPGKAHSNSKAHSNGLPGKLRLVSHTVNFGWHASHWLVWRLRI